METRILLLRHAETAAPDRFHGAESDVGLGERGVRQAENAARFLALAKPEAVYCSGMRRALETARPIAQGLGLEPRVIPELHERRMGPLSGALRQDGWAIYEATKAQWMAGELDATHEGGESFVMIRDRVVPRIQEIADRHEGKTVVVVAHGVVIRVLLSSLLDGSGPHEFGLFGIDFVAVNDLRRRDHRWEAAATNLPADQWIELTRSRDDAGFRTRRARPD